MVLENCIVAFANCICHHSVHFPPHHYIHFDFIRHSRLLFLSKERPFYNISRPTHFVIVYHFYVVKNLTQIHITKKMSTPNEKQMRHLHLRLRRKNAEEIKCNCRAHHSTIVPLCVCMRRWRRESVRTPLISYRCLYLLLGYYSCGFLVCYIFYDFFFTNTHT